MSTQFKPYQRSQMWLAEPAQAAAYREEGDHIALRLNNLSNEELFAFAANISEYDRVRWEAALRLPREKMQELVDVLVQREDDHWWVSVVRLCAPSNTADIKHCLRKRIDSHDRGRRHRAMQLLARMGDDTAIAQEHELLDSKDSAERLVAVTCLQGRDSDESRAKLRCYVAAEANPIETRVRAATALIKLGESEYSDILRSIALNEQSKSAYEAAVSIHNHVDKLKGFELFAQILDEPDHPAAAITVLHVTNLMGKHELGYELVGLEESRKWLASQLAGDAGQSA